MMPAWLNPELIIQGGAALMLAGILWFGGGWLGAFLKDGFRELITTFKALAAAIDRLGELMNEQLGQINRRLDRLERALDVPPERTEDLEPEDVDLADEAQEGGRDDAA